MSAAIQLGYLAGFVAIDRALAWCAAHRDAETLARWQLIAVGFAAYYAEAQCAAIDSRAIAAGAA